MFVAALGGGDYVEILRRAKGALLRMTDVSGGFVGGEMWRISAAPLHRMWLAHRAKA